jgi:hypothetical protein
MKTGIVTATLKDNRFQVEVGGNTVVVNYSDGQTLMQRDGIAEPFLSGNHDQLLPGHSLKVPRVGDPLVIEDARIDQPNWGYLDNYLTLTERRHGSDFKPRASSHFTV